MIAVDALLDAFLNANILICVAYALWLTVRFSMRCLGMSHAHGTQLRLLNTVFCAILLAPLIAMAFHSLQRSGVAPGVNPNLSDMVVAYYLNGGFEMKASEFEGLILMRDTFTLNLINGAGVLAKLVITAFVAGVCIGLVRLLYSVYCLWRIVLHSYAWRRIGRIRIRLSDRTMVPFSTRSWRNYYVVIPSHMLGAPSELKVSLAHEFQHIRQGDLEWEIVLEALKPVFFLNPVYHIWKRQVEALRELNCDRQVLAKGRVDVQAYCDTLLSVCQNTLRRDRSFVLAVPKVTLVTADRARLVTRKRSFLEHRILCALQERHPKREGLLFAICGIPLCAALVFAILAIQQPGDWSQDRLMLATVVNLDRLDEINRAASAFAPIR